MYDDASFHERLIRTELDRTPLSLELRPGVADWLVSLSGLLRPLIELHWTRQVAHFNRVELGEDGLRKFLFGSQRIALRRLRGGLLDAQSGDCFYCGDRPALDEMAIDHFVPWSRMPNDALANLVLIDGRCNGSKSDNYADLDHVQRWATRPREVLAETAEAANWPLRLETTLGIARGLYVLLPTGSRLWSQPGVFTQLDQGKLSDLLPSLRP